MESPATLGIDQIISLLFPLFAKQRGDVRALALPVPAHSLCRDRGASLRFVGLRQGVPGFDLPQLFAGDGHPRV